MRLPKSMLRQESASETLTVDLTPHELEMLTWLAQRAELDGPAALLAALAGDLSASARNGGSDERAHAFSWYKRRFATSYIAAEEASDWREEHGDA